MQKLKYAIKTSRSFSRVEICYNLEPTESKKKPNMLFEHKYLKKTIFYSQERHHGDLKTSWLLCTLLKGCIPQLVTFPLHSFNDLSTKNLKKQLNINTISIKIIWNTHLLS